MQLDSLKIPTKQLSARVLLLNAKNETFPAVKLYSQSHELIARALLLHTKIEKFSAVQLQVSYI